MNIISKRRLYNESNKYPDCKQQVSAWYSIASKTKWNNMNEVKDTFPKVSILSDNRAVFNIKGNSYRLIAKFNFLAQSCYIRFFGTHKDYDKIDANNI